MKNYSLLLMFFLLLLIATSFATTQAIASKMKLSALANNISGIVYDYKRTPLPDIPVELLNDFSQSISRTRTDGGGRYSFTGMPAGRYQIRVITGRYDYEEQILEVELINISLKGTSGMTTSNDSVIQDFYLRPRQGILGSPTITGSVFVQEVPKSAQKIYERAVKEFADKKTDEGMSSLEEAIKVFPNYFLALSRLGFEEFIRENYSASNEILARAADVNPKDIPTLYLLAYSLHLSKKNSASIKVLQYVLTLNSSIPRILLLTGTIFRVENQNEEAEKYLLQAKKVDKNDIPDVHWQLALLYGNNTKRYNEAANELELFLKAQPKSRDLENIKKLIKQFREKAASKATSKNVTNFR